LSENSDITLLILNRNIFILYFVIDKWIKVRKEGIKINKNIEKKQKKEYNIFRSIRDCNKHFIFDIKQKYNVFLTNVLLFKKRHAYCFLCNLDKCCFISRNWIKKYFPALESPGGVFLLCFKPKKVFKSPISLMQYS
jgi:hypothetical protein